MVENDKSNKKRLRVHRVVDVPLHEVSGICLRRSRNGRLFLIAVGDRVAKMAWFSAPRSDGSRIDWHTSNIAKLRFDAAQGSWVWGKSGAVVSQSSIKFPIWPAVEPACTRR